jgi:hypothetical protein
LTEKSDNRSFQENQRLLTNTIKHQALPLAGLLAILAVAGCGGEAPAPTSTALPATQSTPVSASATAAPTATPVPASTLEAVAIDITRDHLPAMVLARSEVELEFPFLQPETGTTGFRDNEQATAQTLDPNDTAQDLAARGRVDGYSTQFVDLQCWAAACPHWNAL